MRKSTADLILRPRRPSDDGFIYRLSDRIFAPYSRHPTGSMATMLTESEALVFVAERGVHDEREAPRGAARAPAPMGGTPTPPDVNAQSRAFYVGGAPQAASPAGFFVLGLERLGRTFGPWPHPAVARLNAIGVQPDLHGRGVGRFLLDRAERAAREAGAVSLTLMTAETNVRARRLFTAGGFQTLFTLDRAYARGQRGIVMTKPL